MGPRLPRARELRGSALRRLDSVLATTARALLVPYMDPRESGEARDWSYGDCPGSRDRADASDKTVDTAARRST
jgi:hypothetical protein